MIVTFFINRDLSGSFSPFDFVEHKAKPGDGFNEQGTDLNMDIESDYYETIINDDDVKKEVEDEETMDVVDRVDVSKVESPVTIAYAASFIYCSDPSSSGLVDASLIIRHSIHKISSRNPESGSKYDYKMYALVHKEFAINCVDKIKDLGFEVILVDPPVDPADIQDETVRHKMKYAWCCKHDEFIKLHAYNLPEEIFVHVDLDFSFHKPMDHLFDAMLYDKNTPEGKAARGKLELQFPEEHVLPDRIDAFFTRDWGQTAPFKGWKSGYQAGFLVARKDPSVIEDVSNVIRTHHYADGWSRKVGWGNKGYANFIVGEVGMQGTMAYFYDEIRPNTSVELNMCRFNHLGMDSRFNDGGPNFSPRNATHINYCRDGTETCEQCKFTPVEDIYSIHFSPCGKPWDCITEGRTRKKGNFIDVGMVDLEHCFELQHLWHSIRSDFEKELFTKTGDESLKKLYEGEFKTDVFLGHCRNETDYISLLEMSDKIVEVARDLY